MPRYIHGTWNGEYFCFVFLLSNEGGRSPATEHILNADWVPGTPSHWKRLLPRTKIARQIELISVGWLGIYIYPLFPGSTLNSAQGRSLSHLASETIRGRHKNTSCSSAGAWWRGLWLIGRCAAAAAAGGSSESRSKRDNFGSLSCRTFPEMTWPGWQGLVATPPPQLLGK